jgi:hypothetical protein
MVSARFGKQHINLVNPIMDFTSFSIACGVTNARNRHFDLHLMNTEDQLFPNNGLGAKTYQPWMPARHAASKIQGSTMTVVINNS